MSKQNAQEAQVNATVARLLNEISQQEIVDYNTLQIELTNLKAKLKEKTDALEVLENYYIKMLEKGATQQEGDLRMQLGITSRRVTPKYKELLARIAGPRAIEEAQEAAGTTTFKHITIMLAYF